MLSKIFDILPFLLFTLGAIYCASQKPKNATEAFFRYAFWAGLGFFMAVFVVLNMIIVVFGISELWS